MKILEEFLNIFLLHYKKLDHRTLFVFILIIIFIFRLKQKTQYHLA
jgi:hypothetical protein